MSSSRNQWKLGMTSFTILNVFAKKIQKWKNQDNHVLPKSFFEDVILCVHSRRPRLQFCRKRKRLRSWTLGRKLTPSFKKTDQGSRRTSSRGGHHSIWSWGNGIIPNAYIIARKGPHVSVCTFCTVALITRTLSIIFIVFYSLYWVKIPCYLLVSLV